MGRAFIVILAALSLVIVACNAPTGGASPTPTKTADIKRSKLDIAYSAFVDQDVHHVTSRKALEAALDAAKTEIKAEGGNADAATPSFQNTEDPQTADFNKFAQAIAGMTATIPQPSADKIADAAISGMIKSSPDCHTYYVDANGGVHNSSGLAPKGSGPVMPNGGTSLGGPDQAGLQGKVLPGGIVYITFHEFSVTGTYKITDAVKAMLDKAVAQGAKAWLFDLRGNIGGNGADLMASWFLNGEPTLSVVVKTGNAGTSSGNKDLRLPQAYQLPIAIVQNDRGGSAPEVFTASLKESKRATVVGAKSVGCLGATSPTHMTDGAELAVAVQEFTGAVTGTKYNNNGITPDVAADDPTAVDKALELLKQKI